MRWLLAVIVVAACHHGSPPPPPPSCTEAADHVLSLLEPKDELARDIRGVFATRCTEDRWPADVRACVVSTVSLKDPKHCKTRLVISARARLEADLSAATQRAKDRAIPESCRAYEKVLERVMTCDRMPQAARDAMRQGFEAMKQAWANQDPTQRKMAEDTCRAGMDAIKQAAGSMGCSP